MHSSITTLLLPLLLSLTAPAHSRAITPKKPLMQANIDSARTAAPMTINKLSATHNTADGSVSISFSVQGTSVFSSLQPSWCSATLDDGGRYGLDTTACSPDDSLAFRIPREQFRGIEDFRIEVLHLTSEQSKMDLKRSADELYTLEKAHLDAVGSKLSCLDTACTQSSSKPLVIFLDSVEAWAGEGHF